MTSWYLFQHNYIYQFSQVHLCKCFAIPLCYTFAMIIFGVDPGIADTGWAVVDGNNTKQTLIAGGLIKTAKTTDQSRRLEEIFDSLQKKLKEYKSEILAVEKIFFNTNLKTAMTVAQTHGIVRLAARKAKIEVVEYTPLQVKISITGYGRAEKKQVQYMVKNILKLKTGISQDDTADAIAVALTHCYNNNITNNI